MCKKHQIQCLVRFSLRCNDSFKDSGGLTACINRAVPALCHFIYSTVRDCSENGNVLVIFVSLLFANTKASHSQV